MFSEGWIDCSVKEMTKRVADAGEGKESRDRSHAEVAAAASRRVHVTHFQRCESTLQAIKGVQEEGPSRAPAGSSEATVGDAGLILSPHNGVPNLGTPSQDPLTHTDRIL